MPEDNTDVVSKETTLEVPNQPIVQARSISHSYGVLRVIENVSCSVFRGSVLGIMAPSGAGKSTLLRLLLHLETPTDGQCECIVSGQDIGLVFQEDNLLPWLTTAENIDLCRQLYGANVSEDTLAPYLRALAIERFLPFFPRELSTGMKQKVALCRLLLSDTTLIALDEGMANIDDLTRYYLCDELRRRVCSGHAGGLFITHNPTDALHLCDTILIGTACPLRVRCEFENPLPRSRDARIRFTPEFFGALESLRKCTEKP